jgi:hypothetical protein
MPIINTEPEEFRFTTKNSIHSFSLFSLEMNCSIAGNVRKTLKIGIITGITNKSLNSKAQTHIPMSNEGATKKMKIKLNENCKTTLRVVYGLK